MSADTAEVIKVDVPDVEIPEVEVTPARLSRHMELTEPELVLINPDKKYFVRFGFPSNYFGEVDGDVMRQLKGPPYVFMAHRMNVTDPEHPQGVDLEDVPTIFMHAGRRNGVWCFSDSSQPVVDYLKELDAYMLDQGLPMVKFVLACNHVETAGVSGITVSDGQGWTVHGQDEFYLPDIDYGDVAQAVGDYMYIVPKRSKMDLDERKIDLTVGSRSKIARLNELVETHGAVKLI